MRITGRGGEFAAGAVELDIGQSAVSTRLLLAMAALRPDATLIDGHISMRNRPNKALVDALAQRSARDMQSTNDGHLPTTVTGTRKLRGPVRVPSNISSQYLTSLLIIAPLLESGLVIEVEGELTSKPYVDLTLDEMAKFGVRVDNHDYRRLAVAPQVYRAEQHRRGRRRLGRVLFRGAGHAARRAHHAQQSRRGHAPGRLRVLRPVRKARRPRRAIRRHAPSSKARASSTAAFDARGRHDQHAGRRAHADDDRAVPDAPTRITGLATLRVKECDRIAAPTRELRKLGVTVEEGPDYMVIEPLARGLAIQRDPTIVEIETYHDHRIAMSFGVLGSRLPGLRILDPGCVAKTYPNYWQDWQRAREVRAARRIRMLRNFRACACAASVPKFSCCVSSSSGRRRSRSAAVRRAAAACGATSTTSPASITWSTTASTAPPKCSRGSRPSRTRRTSSSRSAASCASAAKSTAPSPSTPSSRPHGELQIREQATFALGLDYLSAGPHGSRRGKAAQPAGIGALPARRARAAGLGLRAAARVARGARYVARAAAREAAANCAIVAAHYCCELGEAALAAGDLPAARAQVAAARVHAPDSRARGACWRRASRLPPVRPTRRSSCTRRALGDSRTIRVAFEPEARQALGSRGGRAQRSAARQPAARRSRAAGAAALPLRGVRRGQRHLALALPELPQLGLPAQHAIIAAFDQIGGCGRRPQRC